MGTDRRDENTFHEAVIFKSDVTFEGDVSQTGNQEVTGDVIASGAVQGADLVATDDLTVGDDIAVTGDYTSTNGNITLTNGTLTAADVSVTDDLLVGDDAAITGDLNVSGTFTASGPVSLSGADSISLPTGYVLGRTWTSGLVTQADVVGAQTGQSINLPAGADGAFPAGVNVISAYVETTGTTTVGAGDTLTASIGITGAVESYLAAGSNLAGSSAGKKENAAGTVLGTHRLADTPIVRLTAGADLVNVTALSLRAVILYASF